MGWQSDRQNCAHRPAAQPNGLGTATPAVDPHTAARAKLTNAELATAILKSGRRCVLCCPLEPWFPIHGPGQDGAGTLGQFSCSNMGSVLSSKHAIN